MFTGLIQTVGQVVDLAGDRLLVQVDHAWEDPIRLGESIAVNGCCLTVAAIANELGFDLSVETLKRTALRELSAGVKVNIERALRVGDRLGGHFVQGHVDGVGELMARDGETFQFRVPQGGERYLIDKGSIAIDGISLTVVAPEEREFTVAAIPHTLAHTNLQDRQPGDAVNLEYDVLAKHAERLLER